MVTVGKLCQSASRGPPRADRRPNASQRVTLTYDGQPCRRRRCGARCVMACWRLHPRGSRHMPIPRYRPHDGAALFSAGFRPFFLCAAAWSALAIPLWLLTFANTAAVPTALAPTVWHVHEMVYGYGAATVAGFLLTAIPNWTGRMPLQGGPLMLLVALWLIGRVAILVSARIDDAQFAAICDLAFPVMFLVIVAREIAAG